MWFYVPWLGFWKLISGTNEEPVTPTLLQQLLGLLQQAQQQQRPVTYRQLIEQLDLPAPKIQSLAHLLEQLAVHDARQGWPMRSVLVISQTSLKLPRQGFFDFLVEQKILAEMNETQQQGWHSQELARVYAFSYPGERLCFGGNGELNSVTG